MATFRILCSLLLFALSAPAIVAAEDLPGREIAHAQEKGNCLACHRMPTDPGAVTAATLGPALKNVRERFPDRATLRAQIWDASAKNRDTIMPLYGRHRILTEAEIDLVTDYIHGL